MTDLVSISKEVEWDSGHRVASHDGKCSSPHGHRYRMRVTCTGDIIDDPDRSDNGMLVDFGDLKRIMNEQVADVLDHAFIVHKDDGEMMTAINGSNWHMLWVYVVFPYTPTAENIARWAFDQLQTPIERNFQDDLWLSTVEIWETPTSRALYAGV